jgi:hypothetical protein
MNRLAPALFLLYFAQACSPATSGSVAGTPFTATHLDYAVANGLIGGNAVQLLYAVVSNQASVCADYTAGAVHRGRSGLQLALGASEPQSAGVSIVPGVYQTQVAAEAQSHLSIVQSPARTAHGIFESLSPTCTSIFADPSLNQLVSGTVTVESLTPGSTGKLSLGYSLVVGTQVDNVSGHSTGSYCTGMEPAAYAALQKLGATFAGTPPAAPSPTPTCL